jgi:ribosomal protein L17
MALTATDKKQIEVLIRKEMKSFLKKTQAEKSVVDIIEKEFRKKGGNLTRLNREMMADVATKAIVELYRTFWLRRSFWENQVKRVT